MTTDLEKKFFETFGIEPMLKGYSQVEDNWQGLPVYSGEIKYFNSFEEMNKAGFHSIYDNEENEEDLKEYPTITNKHYLQLLCLLAKEIRYFPINDKDVSALKKEILYTFIFNSKGFSKPQIQKLFKE